MAVETRGKDLIWVMNQRDAIDEMLPSLQGTLRKSAVNIRLTETGLLVSRSLELARLYSKYKNWNEVKQRWHESRVASRGTRGSAQRVFKNLKARFQAGGRPLPPMADLPVVLDSCETTRDQAQILYFYLICSDALFRYVLHELLSEGLQYGVLDVNTDSVLDKLRRFEFVGGEGLSYADSTLRRWVNGLQSVLREVGIIGGKYSHKGVPPAIGEVPMLVSATFSWQKFGSEWVNKPVGWIYLYQPQETQQSLFKRLSQLDSWNVDQNQRGYSVEPASKPFEWVSRLTN